MIALQSILNEINILHALHHTPLIHVLSLGCYLEKKDTFKLTLVIHSVTDEVKIEISFIQHNVVNGKKNLQLKVTLITILRQP